MEVVVSDSNIFIYLYGADLLKFCKPLSLEFYTLDLILEEIESEYQHIAIQSLVDEGVLNVSSLTLSQMGLVLSKADEYARKDKISPVDASLMIYAKENQYRLLTGYSRLRKKAEKEGVVVSGVLFLIDKMVEENLGGPLFMAQTLEELIKDENRRLPTDICIEKIRLLRGEENTQN